MQGQTSVLNEGKLMGSKIQSAVNEATSISAEANVTRKHSWPEIENILDRFREQRTTRPEARSDLANWYALLARPSPLTGTKTLSNHRQALQSWQQQMPDSPTPLIVLAKMYLNGVWQGRTTGDANVAEHIAEARRCLDRALELGVKDGEVYARLIAAARVEKLPHDELEAILRQGMKADPAYVDMYQEMAVSLLFEQHRKSGDIEAFAGRVLRELPGEDGLDVYAHIAYIVNQYEPTMLFWGEYDRQALVNAAEVLVRRYPQQPTLVAFAGLTTMAAQNRAAAMKIRPSVTVQNVLGMPIWHYAAKEFFAWCDTDPLPADELYRVWVPRYSDIGFAFSGAELWYGLAHERQSVGFLNFRTAQIEEPLTGRSGSIASLAFDAQKEWFAMAVNGPQSGGWQVLDLARPNEPHFQPMAEPCAAIAINPRSRQIALASAERVRLIDVEGGTGGPVVPIYYPVARLLYSPDGKQLAIWTDRITVCDSQTGKQNYVLGTSSSISGSKLLCEGLLDFDDEGRIWALAYLLDSRPAKRFVVKFAADGKKWEQCGPDLGPALRTKQHSGVMSRDRRLLAYAEEGAAVDAAEKIHVWDLLTGAQLKMLDGHATRIGMLAFSPDGKMLASIATAGVTIKIWSVE